MWRFAHRAGIATELKALHRPRPGWFLAAALLDWCWIALACAAVLRFGWLAVPAALLVIGNRQRALGNLLHDASHWSMDSNRRRQAVLSNVLFCWPLTVSLTAYRAEHNRHHRCLGHESLDPDLIEPTAAPRSALRLWLREVHSPRMLANSLFGNLRRMGLGDGFGVAVWWLSALALLAVSLGLESALVCAALWFGAKATAFHGITVFREISDHYGLTRGSLIGFSRNHPFAGMLGQLIHPHNNGYHLLHHLAPGIPFHALPRAHELLRGWSPYDSGAQCSGYFVGEASAVSSWVGAAQP